MHENVAQSERPLRKVSLRFRIGAMKGGHHVIRIYGLRATLECAAFADQTKHSGIRGFVRIWYGRRGFDLSLPKSIYLALNLATPERAKLTFNTK